MKNVEDFDDLVGKLRDLATRLERRERHTHIYPASRVVVVEPEPEPEPELPPCVTWSDDFERADGPVGANWVLGPMSGTGEAPELFTISSGAVIGPSHVTGPGVEPIATMTWAAPVATPDQWVEVVVDGWASTDPAALIILEIFNFVGGGLSSSEARRASTFRQTMSPTMSVTIDAYSYLDDGDTTSGAYVQWNPYTGSTGPATLRLDSYASGRQVVTFNGAVVLDYVETGTPFAGTGYRQGVWMAWRENVGRTSPRILSITGGCLEPSDCVTFSDDFERTTLGPDWITATAGPSSGVPEPLTIASGAAVDATQSGTSFGDADPSVSFWATPFPGDHFVEFDVESMGGGNNYVFIYVRFDPVTWTGISYNFVTSSSSPWLFGNLRRVTYTNGVAGTAVLVGDAEPLTTLRLQSAGGTTGLYANGALIDEYDDTDYAAGSYVGIGAGWASHASATASPRIASVTGGCLEGS